MTRYYKRFRMEYDLRRMVASPTLADGYEYLGWRADLLEFHAEAKHRSFSGEVDSRVFPCLGEPHGCSQLMHEIADRDNFLPEATWLAVLSCDTSSEQVVCGTIQGLCASGAVGSIQNIGTVPEHRGHGIGTGLILRALHGFQSCGLRKAALEVTAENVPAVRLYTRLGFRHVRTLYKSVEVAYS